MTTNVLVFNGSDDYSASSHGSIRIPKCSLATIQVIGAGGGGGCGEEQFGAYLIGNVYTSMGGGGGGGGTCLELQLKPSLLDGNSELYFILGEGGVGGKHNRTPNPDFSKLAGGNGGNTQLIYTFNSGYPPTNYYEIFTALGGKGGDYGTLNRSTFHGNGGDGGNGYTYTPNLPPNVESNFIPISYRSFGGGGGLYVSFNAPNVGGSGGAGYSSDFTIPASYLAGTSGTFSNVNGNVHAGFGGGSLASIGGAATSFYGIENGYFLCGAGSGGSPGNAIPINRQNTITNPTAGGGAGYPSFGLLRFTNASAPVNAISGGGGGGGVGGVTNLPALLATYEINGQDAGRGGNGTIILSYTL